MIETNLRHRDLIDNEPSLESLLHENQADYQVAIDTSYTIMIQDIKNQNLLIRKLCKELWLQETSKTTTAAFNSAESKEDFVERLRLIINVTSLSSGPAIFNLQGRNKSSDSWTSMKQMQIEETGNHKFNIIEVTPNSKLNTYRFYRLQKTDTSSTVTYTSYLVELTYENLHLWKALSLVFENLVEMGEDVYRSKADKYEALYQNHLVNNKYYYDSDDDGDIDDIEAEADYRSFRIKRGSW